MKHINPLQHHLLSLLPKERTGPELIDEYRSRVSKISPATFYAALRRMEDSGWIKSRFLEGSRRTRTYWITADGKRALSGNQEYLKRLWRFGLEGS
jgi:DNA-binding PadR family transcriptional regulator